MKTAAEAASVGLTQMLGMRSVQIGLLLFAFQQFAGINAIVYFSTAVFRKVQIDGEYLIWVGRTIFGMMVMNRWVIMASLAVGVTNVIGTIIAASIIEKAGRTTLLSNSYLGQAVAMFAMAAGFSLPALKEYSAPIAVVGTLFYILTFALGAGPVTALIIPELNPASIRGWLALDHSMFPTCFYSVPLYDL
jgi:hypothetical protein